MLATVALIAIIDHRIMEILRFEWRIVIILLFAGLFLGFLYREGITSPARFSILSLFRIRMFTLSGLSLPLVGVAQVMVGFVLPFYLQDILHCPRRLWVFVYQCTGFHGDLVSPCRLGCGQGRPAAAFDRGHSFPRDLRRSRRVSAADSHWISAVLVFGVVGIGNRALLSTESRGHDRLGSRATSGRGSGEIMSCSVWEAHLGFRWVRCSHRGVSLLQRRCVATPTPANPVVFVSAMNFTFFVAGIMGLVAMACSAMRGKR